MTTTATATFRGETHDVSWIGKGFGFVSFYTDGESDRYLIVKHRSEAAARKGSWQTAAMREVWTYVGYAAIER